MRKRLATGSASVALGVLAALATPATAWAQQVICCNQPIQVDGPWTGSGRVQDCQEYFNSAPTAVLRKMCEQRQYLGCINTARCSQLPPDDAAKQDPPGGPASPPNTDRDGLEEGFYGPAPAAPPPAPATPQAPPGRLVYILMGVLGNGKSVAAFTAYLDRAACPVPLAANNAPSNPVAARHVVRGQITRGNGRVRIDAEATEIAAGSKSTPVTAEVQGEGQAAVAEATRAALKQMNLVCSR